MSDLLNQCLDEISIAVAPDESLWEYPAQLVRMVQGRVNSDAQIVADLRQLIADLLPHVDFVKPSPVWLKRYYRPSCQLCGVKRDDNGDWLHAPTCAYDRADKIRKGER